MKIKSKQKVNTVSAQSVRIAILTFRRPQFLYRMIRSLKFQTYANFEVCIFDNASKDETEHLIDQITREDIRFSAHINDDNIGPIENAQLARNWCEKGEFFAILHDDDYLESSWLENSINFLQANPNVGLICSNAKLIRDSNSFITLLSKRYAFSRKTGHRVFNTNYEFLTWLFSNGSLMYPSIVYRASATKKASSFIDSKICDIIFYLDVTRYSQAAIMFVPLFNYQIHNGQDTSGICIKDIQILKEYISTTFAHCVSQRRQEFSRFISFHKLGIIRKEFRGLPFGKRVSTLIQHLHSGQLASPRGSFIYCVRLVKTVVSP